MTDRPILFSAPMVRTILDGSKTQTRRVIKPQPYLDKMGNACCDGWILGQGADRVPNFESLASPIPRSSTGRVWCPYGQIGDRLWVREEHYRFGHWEEVSSVRTRTGRQKWAFVQDSREVLFDAPAEFRKGRHNKDTLTPAWHKRLARFMPRSASRITLEITDVRVERLQDISRGDAMEEGCPFPNMASGDDPRRWFSELWQSINGPASWEANPWVWVIGFKRVDGGKAGE